MLHGKAAIPHDKPEVNHDLVAAVCITVDDGSDCDEIWYLTNEQDAILDAEQILFVSTPEELLEELEVKYFCDEGLSRIRKSIINSQQVYDQESGRYNENYYDGGRYGGNKTSVNFKTLESVRKTGLPSELEYLKKENGHYRNDKNKLIFKVLTSPIITSTNVEVIIEAVKKYGTLYLKDTNSIWEHCQQIGMTNYLSDDIKVVDYTRLDYIPGVKAKHKKRLAASRKRRTKVGKISYKKVLFPLAKIVINGLQEMIDKIVVKENMAGCIKLDVSHPDLKGRKASMEIIADGVKTIQNLNKLGKEYQAGFYGQYGQWDGKKYQNKDFYFVDLIKACVPSIENLLKSKQAHEVSFGKVIQAEYEDLVRQGKIKGE